LNVWVLPGECAAGLDPAAIPDEHDRTHDGHGHQFTGYFYVAGPVSEPGWLEISRGIAHGSAASSFGGGGLSILSDRQTTPGQAWDRFAEVDPYTYILTSLKRADPQEFWESGYRTVREELLPVLRTFRVSRNSGLELGCGLGRLVFPLASHFQKMIGVDISSGMIQRACRFAKYNSIANAITLLFQ